MKNFYNDDLTFTNKYDINILLNNIQTDTEKLFNFIKKNLEEGKRFEINQKDFIIDDSLFFDRFKNVNFDEFIGLQGLSKPNELLSASKSKSNNFNNEFDYLTKLSNRIGEINKMTIEDTNCVSTDKGIKNLVRKLVTYEVLKTKNIDFDSNNIDNIMTEIIERERNAIDDLIKQGKLNYSEKIKDDKQVYLNELLEIANKFKNSDNEIINKKKYYGK